MQERLQKIISAAGIASRRAAEQLILDGRVRVNGRVVTELGSRADPERDHIKVDGKLINPRQPKTYLLLNKPVGYVTTLSDPEGRPIVQDLLKGVRVRVYPVGRLDYNTEGLLLLTNDGDFAHLVMHPKHELPKTYLVKIKGVLSDEAVRMLEAGVYLKDGRTAPAAVKRLRKEEANSWIEITIHEGKKRQVRRMIDHTGCSVIRLKRVRVGNLPLGDLPPGTYRHLAGAEVKALREMAGGMQAPTAALFDKDMMVKQVGSPAVRKEKPAGRKRGAPERKREPQARAAAAMPRTDRYRQDRVPFRQKREDIERGLPRTSFGKSAFPGTSARPARRHEPAGRNAGGYERPKSRPFEGRRRPGDRALKREPQPRNAERPRTTPYPEGRGPFQQQRKVTEHQRPRSPFPPAAPADALARDARRGPRKRSTGGAVRSTGTRSFDFRERPKGSRWGKPAAGKHRTGGGKGPKGRRPQRPGRPGR